MRNAVLLSDGSVMVHDGNPSSAWYQLQPDSSGGYVDGTWSQLASMDLPRLYFSTTVLPDGRVLVLGGEFTNSNNEGGNTGEIYDPVTNTWTDIAPFPGPYLSDVSTETLPNGQVLVGAFLPIVSGTQQQAETFIYDPTANTWTQTGTKLAMTRATRRTGLNCLTAAYCLMTYFPALTRGTPLHSGTFHPLASGLMPGPYQFR